ncbi:hypothetical protein B0J17DRAFT_633585 [Rhizoctonia solani]|nr:hypothetical protein B0J17DRAFT_633585 [Rhizoctonia solani]
MLTKRLEWLELQSPNITIDDLYGPLHSLLATCFRFREDNDWMLHPRPKTGCSINSIERSIRTFNTAEYVVCKFTAAVDNDKARLIISIVVNDSDTRGIKRLEKWTQKLYEGLDDAHGGKVLQRTLIMGVFAQVFNIAKDGQVVTLAPASEKMNIRNSEFLEYFHKCSLEIFRLYLLPVE